MEAVGELSSEKETEVDIVDLLRREGYKVVEGAEAVREAIRRSAMGKGVYGKI